MEKILIETNNAERFQHSFRNELKNLEGFFELEFQEDIVPFGDDQLLIAGIIFAVDSVKSGIIYDILKEFCIKWFSHPEAQKQLTASQNKIVFLIEERSRGAKKRKKLEITYSEKDSIKIRIPEKGEIIIERK